MERKRKFRTKEEIIKDEKTKRFLSAINTIPLKDFTNKTVKLKKDFYDKRISNGELSELFIDWYNKNKDRTFVARKASNTEMDGMYEFDSVENWMFNENMIEEVADVKQTPTKWYVRLYNRVVELFRSMFKRKN